MEENKSNCENCSEKYNCPCYNNTNKCCSWKSSHLARCIFLVIIIVLAFCIGSQYGKIKAYMGNYNFHKCRMMDWKYKNIEPLGQEIIIDDNLNTETQTQ
jgi:hypothetical protein